jgi:hypothetical protein
MPADQRLRPHDNERVTPIKQPEKEDQTHASRSIDASGLDAPPFIERQLTAQEEALCFQRALPSDRQKEQPEQVRQEPEEDMGNGDHVLMMP